MELRRFILMLGFCACDSIAPRAGDANGDHTEPEPLPADLIAACPESARFERSGGHICTAVGCQNGYVVDVSPNSGWAPGAYRFELTVDGRAITCQGSLPLERCGEQSFSCDADGVRLGESGCALPPDQQGLANITFDNYPLELSIRVLKNNAELVSAELAPVYTTGQPNGPGCDPICCSASGKLTVPSSR